MKTTLLKTSTYSESPPCREILLARLTKLKGQRTYSTLQNTRVYSSEETERQLKVPLSKLSKEEFCEKSRKQRKNSKRSNGCLSRVHFKTGGHPNYHLFMVTLQLLSQSHPRSILKQENGLIQTGNLKVTLLLLAQQISLRRWVNPFNVPKAATSFLGTKAGKNKMSSLRVGQFSINHLLVGIRINRPPQVDTSLVFGTTTNLILLAD